MTFSGKGSVNIHAAQCMGDNIGELVGWLTEHAKWVRSVSISGAEYDRVPDEGVGRFVVDRTRPSFHVEHMHGVATAHVGDWFVLVEGWELTVWPNELMQIFMGQEQRVSGLTSKQWKANHE